MIHYITGDATNPLTTPENDHRLILHVCNDVGAWGAGFVIALSKRWETPEFVYRNGSGSGSGNGSDQNDHNYVLGTVQFVPVDPNANIVVVNMIAQHGIGRKVKAHMKHGKAMPRRYINYESLRTCLKSVNAYCGHTYKNSSIHMPRIGCGLGGGSWPEVELIINECLPDIDIYVYDLDAH